MNHIQNRRVPSQVTRLLGLSLVLAFVFVSITIVNYINARQLMMNYLENEGISFGQQLESIVRSKGAKESELPKILADNVNRDSIAYVLLYDRKGAVIAKVGGTQRDGLDTTTVLRVLKEQKLVAKRLEASNGDKVYEINMPFHVGGTGQHQQLTVGALPKFQVIKIGVKESFAAKFIDSAFIQVFFAVIVVVIIAVFSVSQLNTLKDYFTLQEKMKDQEKLAAIGMVSAGLAHEIRNPVGAIKGFAQLLAEDDFGEQNIYLGSILKESLRLEHTVNELLDYTKKRVLTVTDIELNSFIGDCLGIVCSRFNIEPSMFRNGVPVGVRFRGDRAQLEQVMLNLLTNSVQASMTMTKRIQVSIEGGVKESSITIAVADNGPGLPTGQEGQVFQPFFTTKEKGVGLGLAISQQIVNAHGGHLTAENISDGGARFTIILPAGGPDANF